MKSRVQKRLAVGCLALVAGTAMAGPDVIVGELPDVWHWGSVGTSPNIIESYSVATTSCNKGDTPLEWTASNNRHPVIGQNMYRLDPATKRFQQLGQSWLKHGFTALQGTACFSDCSAWPNGTRLGVHCSDPYGSSLNGDQTRLGPKSEVNAATGFYPYPYVLQGTTGTLGKRLQVRRTDLQTANALYFVSGHYIAPDDAAAGNGGNNESYRRVTVDQANFNVSTSAAIGATQREKPAIQAWRDHGLGVNTPDTSILITPVDIAGDGRMYVGVKVVDLGGGQFRYEYAVQNLSSDRSGSSFSIPLPANAVVTGVGFSDVPYHSGEPYNSTDWTSNVTSSAVTWTCTETFAQNANANALRWSAMYNFWFTCNVGSSGGAATIGLFKPGATSSVTVGTQVPSPDGQNHPSNDSCAAAASISNGVTNYDSTGATTDGPDEPGGCVVNAYTQIGADIWYRWTNGTCSNPATISTCGSSYDTKIAVYPDVCPTGSGQYIACSDDFAACGLDSEVTFTPAANTSYLIRVGGYNAAVGAGVITITPPFCAPPPGPANDLCADAIWLADGQIYSESTGATGSHVAGTASTDIPAVCGSSATSADVWFKYRPQTTTLVALDTCGSAFDTVVSVYTGVCGALTQVACNDDNGNAGPCPGGTTSYINVTLNAGQTYYIRVAGWQGQTGAYNLRVLGGGGVTPPSNDNCANRIGVSLGTNNFSTINASTDGPTHTGCNFGGNNQITNDIWFNYPSNAAGVLTAETCAAATFDTKMAIYSGDSCTNFDARLLACNDNDGSCTAGRSKITLPVVAGQSYTIRLGGFNGASGTGILTLSFVPDAACDPDVNQDGNVDQGDVDYLINVVGGGANPTGIDADFNRDGNVDQGDVDSLISVIAGANCP